VNSAPVQRSEARLAWELVAKIAPLPDILRRHNLTVEKLRVMLKEPMFRSMVVETKKIWESELNTKERIRIKAQLLVEDSMLDVYGIVQNDQMSPQVRVDAFEQLAKIGNVATPDKQDAVSERTVITINIPGAQAPITVSAEKPALEGAAA
jgi:hypothetical protein